MSNPRRQSSASQAAPLSTLHEWSSGPDLASLAGANSQSQLNHSKKTPSRHSPSLSHSIGSNGRPNSALAAGRHPPRQVSNEYFNSYRPVKDAESTGPADPDVLLKVQHGVTKARSGSVLGRGFILKNDRLPARATHSLDFRLKGAPHFRPGGEGIYGSAQPSITGLRTILATLGCHPGASGKAVWICTREEPVIYIGGSPFVLRDAEEPLQNYALSERPEALESIEKRLKADILREATRYGGLVQVQEEVDNDASEFGMSPTWIAASSANVMTMKELSQSLKDEGFDFEYHRIAISSDEDPQNRYLDDFLTVLRGLDTDVGLYFNCGVGVVRTTFAMTMALLLRRHQKLVKSEGGDSDGKSARRESVIDRNAQKNLIAEANAIDKRNQTLLRLTSVLNSCTPSNNQHNLLQILFTNPQLLENLRLAVDGDYNVVLNLLSCLENGIASKSLADAAINQCDSIINLRELVLFHRVNLAFAAMDDQSRNLHLKKATAGLERYFFLVAFASFIASTDRQPNLRYSEWLDERPELRNMVTRLRLRPDSGWIFAPVADLTSIARGPQLGVATPLAKSRFNDVIREGAEVIGDEFSAQLVRRRKGITLRAGMILKKDIWRDALEDGHDSKAIRGALNYRRIPNTRVYALSQPTDSGIVGVLDSVDADKADRTDEPVTWINLREEPLCYINGAPYVLREESLSLRNLKSYAGISASRLELIEDRLKRDVLAELQAGDGRILLHTETSDGTVIAVWESVQPDNIATLREVMESMMQQRHFNFRRMPITAEGPPNFADVADLVEVASVSPLGHSVIVNCQLGRGRSTLVSIMLTLFRQWLESGGRKRVFAEAPHDPPRVSAYAVINNLIRVIRNGREIKMHVDSVIQQCSEIYNLLDAIEDARQAAEDASDDKTKHARTRRGRDDLRRYFVLVLFAAWLNESAGDSVKSLRAEYSFERYVNDHPVYQTILKEIDAAGAEVLAPLGNLTSSDEVASDEVEAVVAARDGRILSNSTILKSDFFSNLQKLSLPDRVEGAPNYRQTPMYVEIQSDDLSEDDKVRKSIYGTGMPAFDGLARALDRMGAGKVGKSWVYWTLMREEPVIFVRGRPHVLRLLALPLENVITTGVTAESVEGQENALKSDVLREIEKHNGRLLLHDETDDGNGRFTLTAQWEDNVQADDILTPKEVYERMVQAGYRVNYARLPVTDEQAPIPRVFARLEERVADALQHADVAMAFNCQMGRGRTTTAMVAASLVATLLHPEDVSHNKIEVSPLSAVNDSTFEIREIEDPYLNGEYKIIFQLMSVLQYGKQAKCLADKAIDQCEAVQNLRKAVATYKIQWESAEEGSTKKEKVGNLAFNYLYRYGTLIAFTNYLLEKKETQSGTMSSSISALGPDVSSTDFPSFPEYMRRRPEIDSILRRRVLD